MFNTKYLYLALLASIPYITYTAEPEREYCISDTCGFSRDRKDEVTIHNLACPPQEQWYNASQFDAIDKLIFIEYASIPYTHSAITSTQETKTVYVMRKDYETLKTQANTFFYSKLTSLESSRAAIETNENESNDFRLLTIAITRVNTYLTNIAKMDRYRHLCPGAMVTPMALKCILQVKGLNQY
jgi:hypothetical protein